ncbi:transcriptional regulator [Cryobacterium melibiosiphilum]|uniref:Transcriptional regulator n=1 Tax=Cryobacterium melibiosiphilum TaxID=995039 RepID=A0A3A5MPS0_9MICO|nr:metalloregulator ArsR/SmtB family transcription factor [Cryobacterium melibiosiphilum]RJT91342.1 transcriptional regulator [Cryobacterium melibiosiphilum]
MGIDRGVTEAAELFKALASTSRLTIMRVLSRAPATVSELVLATEQSQPLVSQHLKVLRNAGVVIVTRSGREATYAIADQHVAHVVEDAINHVLEISDPDSTETTTAHTH